MVEIIAILASESWVSFSSSRQYNKYMIDEACTSRSTWYKIRSLRYMERFSSTTVLVSV